MKLRLQDLQDECWTKIGKFQTIVVMPFELCQELLRSLDFLFHVASRSEVPNIVGEDAAGLRTELKKAKAHIAELESVGTMSVRRHENFTEEAKQRHAEEVSFGKRPFGRMEKV